MTNFTPAQLLAVLQTVDPVFNGVQMYDYVQDPKQRQYTSVDIKTLNPQSNDASVQLIDYKTRFEINIYVKWADRTEDTDNLNQLERNILTAILSATLTTGKLILEDNDFQQGNIRDNPLNVNGIQSTLTLYFDVRAAVDGIIGLQQSLDIGSITGLKILSESFGSGENWKRRSNDSGDTKVNKGMKEKNRYFEYPYTKTNYDIIETLKDNDNVITVTLHEQSQGDTTFTGKVVYQRGSVRFDSQKTVILEFEISQ